MKSAATMIVGLALGMGVSPDAPLTKQAQKQNLAGDQQAERLPLDAIVLIKIGRGHGTGVVIDAKRRLIITNAHVVRGQFAVVVHLRDGTKVAGRVLYRAANRLDLALVQLDPIVQLNGALPVVRKLSAAKVACRMAKAPERVTAIGHPGPFRWAVSKGHVAGQFTKSRALGRGLVLDLTIWHGNSGGGLFDAQGRLIGITTAIFGKQSMTGQVYSGFSFAVSGVDVCKFLKIGAKPAGRYVAPKVADAGQAG